MKNFEEIRNDFENWKYQKEVQFKRKAENTWDWIVKNKDILVVTIPAALGIAGSINKGINRIERRNVVRREENLKNRYIYDRSLGFYYKCKRDLRPNELLEIDARKRKGEPLGSILRSMNLI